MRSVMKRADRNMIADVVDALRARARRRRWCDDVKAQIVAESYAPGAVISEVARWHEISPQQLSAWRKAARDGLLKLPDGTEPVARMLAGTAAIPDVGASGRKASGVPFGPHRRHEFIKTRGRPEIDQLGENVGQVGLRLDAAELAGLDQRSDAGPVLRALIMPREGVADMLGDSRLARDAGELLLEPGLERQHEGLAAFLADGTALIGAAAPDHLLDGIESGDTLERLAGDRGRTGLDNVEEAPPQVSLMSSST
jgi:transposase-like protein